MCQFTDSIVCVQPNNENGVVFGIESGNENQEGKGSERLFFEY